VLNRGVGAEDEIGKDARVQRPEPTLGQDVPPRLEEARLRHARDDARVGHLECVHVSGHECMREGPGSESFGDFRGNESGEATSTGIVMTRFIAAAK
jgi:hypothetical protein